MAKIMFDLQGIDDIQRKISRWQVKKTYAVKELVKRTANNVRRNAKRRVPVKSGRLKKSIVVLYSKDKSSAYVRAVAPHSHLVEFGTAQGARPHPFMRPAFEGQKAKYEKQIKKIFEEV